MIDADKLTADIAAVGGCAVGATFLGGSLAGPIGALAGTVIGLIIGVVVVRSRRR